jgi:hypothetical protein
MTYATLQTDIADYLHRTDLTAVIPTFIARAESYMFRDLDIKETETSATGTTTSGYATLPSDFGSVSKISVSYGGGSSRLLDYAPQAWVPSDTDAYPAYYSLEKNQLRIYGASDGTAYTLYYKPVIPALSVSQTTNWLLTNAPDLYLYCSSLEGARYIRDAAEAQRLEGMIPAMMDSVRRLSERRGQPSAAPMQIKVRRG